MWQSGRNENWQMTVTDFPIHKCPRPTAQATPRANLHRTTNPLQQQRNSASSNTLRIP